MKTVRIAVCLSAMAVVTLVGHAAPKGEGTLICATTHTVECDGIDEECRQGGSDIINFPQFFRIDFENREIHILDPGRRDEITGITHLARSQSRGWTILHGMEDGRPWSMVITEQTGRFSLVINEDDAAFNVFGACTAP